MRAFNDPREEDNVYALMLDALDGELTAAQEEELASYFQKYPDLATEFELMGENTFDFATVQVSLASPSALFVEETIAYLPNLRLRRYVMASLAILLMVATVLPVAGLLLLLANASLELVEVFVSGLAQLVYEAGYSVLTQPVFIAIIGFMLGSILLWSTMYRRLVLRPVTISS